MDNLSAPTAVTTIDDATLQRSGTVDLAEILRVVPSFGESGLTPTNSAFLTQGAGISTLELRSLGEDRTLVLVDGKRYVPGVAGTSEVDFNTIPTDLVERVEVITGGASAIYGSDALAGVVNVILKQDFDGVTVNAQYGQSGHSDEIIYKTGLTAGANFDNGRGNAVFSVGWSRNEGVKSANRANSAEDNTGLCIFTGVQSDCATPLYHTESSFSAYGRFTLAGSPNVYTVSPGTGPSGTVVPFTTQTFNRNAYRTIEVPVDRLLMAENMHYDLNSHMQLYLDSTLAITTSSTSIEPFPSTSCASPAATSAGCLALPGAGGLDYGISINNPFVPAALKAAAIGAGDTTIGFRRRLVEFGPRQYTERRDTWRTMLGVKGTVLGDFDYDAFFSWGHTLDTLNGSGQYNETNFAYALDARLPGVGEVAKPGGGGFVCNSVVAQAQGCIPINIFGLGAITPQALAYVQANQQRIQNIDEKVLGATIQGPVYTLPAGDIHVVGGVEYRIEGSSDIPDPLTQAGQNGSNQSLPTMGGYHVAEIFTETEIPLLKDMPFAKELTVGGAFRWSQYNTAGDTESYTGRASWSPIDDVRFRAQYARAVRAPNINELFAPGGENFAPVADPCNGVTAATPGQTAANCRSIPSIAARIAATGSFTLTLAEIQGTGGFTGSGNPLLSPEKSDSWQGGVVVTHDFDTDGMLTASVDYYNIKINNVIATIGRQQSLDLCYTQGVPFPNAFCSAIVRQTGLTPSTNGAITQVNSGFGNDGALRDDGLDFAATYSVDLNNVDFVKQLSGATDNGQLAARVNWSWLLKYDQVQFGLLTIFRGTEGTPVHKVQGALVYTLDNLTLQWDTTYMSATTLSKTGFFATAPVPSYMLHEVAPYHGERERITVAFNAWLRERGASGDEPYVRKRT